MPNYIRKYIKGTLERRERHYSDTATIYDIQGDHADIRIGNASNVLHYIPILGDYTKVTIGQVVSLRWEERSGSLGKVPTIIPIAAKSGSGYTESEMAPDNESIEFSPDGMRIKKNSIKLGDLAFTPALAGHIHNDSLSAHGWQIDTNGTIFAKATYIHSDGQISLGLSPDIIKLDGMHPTHRIWVGSVIPETAPFSVSKEGAISATAGYIAGWTIEPDCLSSDDAFIDSSVPAIGIGATGFEEGVGFWTGYDTSAYKLFIGDPAGDYLSWDGDTLTINGSDVLTPRFSDYVVGLFTDKVTLVTFAGELEVVENPFRITQLNIAPHIINRIYMSVSDAPVGSSIIINIKNGGSTIFAGSPANYPKITAGNYSGYYDMAVNDTKTWAYNEYLTVEIILVGSSTPGSNLAVHIQSSQELNYIL